MNRFLALLVFVVTSLTITASGAMRIAAVTPVQDPLPPEKQATEDQLAANRLTGHPADKANDPGRPLVIHTDGPPLTGLFESLDAPISGTEFSPTNAWAGWVSKNYVRIWAGSPSGNGSRGLLLMVTRSGDDAGVDWDSAAEGQLISVPIPGPIRIQRVEDGELLIGNTAGSTVRFALATRAFR